MNSANIAIFASGSGSNAENISRYLSCQLNSENGTNIRVVLILSNKKDAYVLSRAAQLGIETVAFTKFELEESLRLDHILETHKIDFIVLAGFLLKFPERLIRKYPERIVNIHPALLPAYGGKGMYGHHVHRALLSAGERESGITIHLVDELYDNGKHLFQAKCGIEPEDTPESLAAKIHQLEAEYFPKVVYDYIREVSK